MQKTSFCYHYAESFSMTLSKGSLKHKSYFNHYWDVIDDTQSLVREHVDSKSNYEHVAMALLIASEIFSSTPMLVEGNVMDKRLFNGISTSSSISSLNQVQHHRTLLQDLIV